jgi:uncharacterized protein (DUF2147 family)
MRILLTAAVFAIVGATTAFADPVEGIWKTQVDDGAYAHVEISPCGSNFCGTIIRTFRGDEEYASPNIGKQLVRNMAAKGGGSYKGNVWRPSNDKIYKGKLKLNGNALAMSGCVAGGLICSKQSWSRLK